MKKHAYLIIANKNVEQLNILIEALDDVRNDIFLLIDKKSNLNIDTFKVTNSNLYILNDLKVYWGSYSQIEAEMELFDRAYNTDNDYSYYHLLSGADMPLFNQDYIHNFFDNHPNQEFMTFSSMGSQPELKLRTKHYFFDKHFRDSSILFKIFNKIEFKIYRTLMSKNTNYKIYFGANWGSFDNEAVEYFLKKRNNIEKQYKHGHLVDELYKHNIIMNNPKLRSKIYVSTPVSDKPGEFQGSLRYINWWDGKPYTWTINDYDKLIRARKMGHLFSRKFDENVDNEIILKIRDNFLK